MFYLTVLLMMILSRPLDAAKILGVYDPQVPPPKGFRDVRREGPVADYGQPMGAEPLAQSNPYATRPPSLYDGEGNYRGRWSDDWRDPDSISNPQSRFYKEYINPYETLYIVDEEINTQPYQPSWLEPQVKEIEIESGPVWSGPFWNNWRWDKPYD